MRPYMTFEVKVQFMKNLCLNNIIIHTYKVFYKILDQKISNKNTFSNIKVNFFALY